MEDRHKLTRTEMRLPPDLDRQRLLFGPHDRNFRLLRAGLGVNLVARGGRLVINGDEWAVGRALNVLERMLEAIDKGQAFVAEELATLMERQGEEEEKERAPGAIFTDRLRIVARSANQAEYIRRIRENSLVFGLGPAGSGKTYLAVASAVEALRHGEVKRLILTRPAVEAGEHLGFLPGDMREKVDPYLKPIYDALDDMISRRQLADFGESGILEVAPLAYMRGRTLARSFVILDEAQNTTPGQMKMFLTRLGERSRCVVTGDLTQIDLEASRRGSGLVHAVGILEGIDDIAVVRLTGGDIVRHPLVRRIVAAYDGDGEEGPRPPGRGEDAPGRPGETS
ncbi:MAG: PhoH family protein [Planctomycetota bacterium]|jgi:phosphate starvation-inducible PhoH-like protein|nr:PhoH family protein [Planctomycetota bacterium]